MDKLKQEILTFFKDITFNEEFHKYYVKGEELHTSVSGVIKNFYEEFNAEVVSHYTAKKEGKTQEEVLKAWRSNSEEACRVGSKVHLFGECYALDRSLKPENGYERAIVKFFEDLPEYIIPLLPEVLMYHKDYLFGGTADLPLYNIKENKIYITDYKTNKDLFKNYKGKRMLGRFSDFLDNPFNHYQIQLSLYQILLEQVGYEVSGRKIIHLLPSGEYLAYDTENLTGTLKRELKIIYNA